MPLRQQDSERQNEIASKMPFSATCQTLRHSMCLDQASFVVSLVEPEGVNDCPFHCSVIWRNGKMRAYRQGFVVPSCWNESDTRMQVSLSIYAKCAQ